ncbi:Hypothetical predicted protein [Mytilus galloprovincialis]|uniref:Uncharacterized protein n=1 Tax=Mytilus galloprovincialis TaxID=29158 RepID=A0A8B6CYV9_MYTGA|nr:Hypothetical predicted protein [Mytilus galloprovincialis]
MNLNQHRKRIKKDQSKGPDLRHHEQVKSRQDTFARQVKAFCSVLEEMGNPFMEQSDDLLILDTRDIVDPRVAETVRKVEEIGKEQFNKFVTERLQSNTKSIYEPIKQNKLFMFSRQQPKTDSKEKQQISSLKQNCSLFSQLYVSCQVRNGDLVEFFRHENQAYPPSLSQFGELRHGSKSDLLVQLERITESVNEAPRVDALVIDGAALINMLKPRGSKTFESYCKDIVVPYIRGQLLSVRRIDMVWDEYIQDSLKASERSRRGKGIRRRVLPDSKVPGNWEAFLRVDENKKELFAYISEQLVSRDIVFDEEKQIVSTTGSNVNCRKEKDVSKIAPCTQEEADTRMMLHVNDAVADGHKCVMIRTVDTDVVVIAISVLQKIESILELWIAFGVGKNFRYLSIHDIANALGPEKSHTAFYFFMHLQDVTKFLHLQTRGKKVHGTLGQVMMKLQELLTF